MFVVGLTGGIASGKSLVARWLESLGALRFSADEAARAVTGPRSPLMNQIALAFGPNALTPWGELDRTYLAQCVFSDEAARQTLEHILHPAILRLLWAQIQACKYDFEPTIVVVVEVPLLFETHLEPWFNKIVAVYSPEPLLVERLQARDLLTREEARQRLATQWPVEKKAAQADFVIRNDGDLRQLSRKVLRLWRILQQEARREAHGLNASTTN